MARPWVMSALSAAALIAAGGVAAQTQSTRESGAIERTRIPPRPTPLSESVSPPTPATEAWLAKDVQGGDWRLVTKAADGAVFARPAGQVRSDGVVPVHLRIEFINPVTLKQRPIRSVQADITVDCGTKAMGGDANGFEGQNLTGHKISLEPGEVTLSKPGEPVRTQNARAEAMKLITSDLIRQQCVEGHQGLTAKYGADWRPLLSDEKGVRLAGAASGPASLDRKLDLKFRIEAKDTQTSNNTKWRSAIASVKIDCVDGGFSADTQLFAGADETGAATALSFEGYRTPMGTMMSRAPGQAAAPVATPASTAPAVAGGRGGFAAGGLTDAGPGKAVLEMLRNGGMISDECDDAKARLAKALGTPNDPLRKQAEAWAGSTLNTKGFRLPTYVPEGVLMLSDEVVASGPARRALVRAEFSRPVPTRDGKKMASRITVLEVDCAAKKVRGVSESTFARHGARELIKETPAAPNAPWAAYEDAPAFEGYFEAICATKVAGP